MYPSRMADNTDHSLFASSPYEMDARLHKLITHELADLYTIAQIMETREYRRGPDDEAGAGDAE